MSLKLRKLLFNVFLSKNIYIICNFTIGSANKCEFQSVTNVKDSKLCFYSCRIVNAYAIYYTNDGKMQFLIKQAGSFILSCKQGWMLYQCSNHR